MSVETEAPARAAGLNLVGGEWRPASSGATYEKRNPARPREVVGLFPASAEADVDAAVDAAAAAFPAWSKQPGAARAAVLIRAAELLEGRVEQIAADMTREMGKPIREARMETARGAQILRYFAGEAWRPRGGVYQQSVSGGGAFPPRAAPGRRPAG